MAKPKKTGFSTVFIRRNPPHTQQTGGGPGEKPPPSASPSPSSSSSLLLPLLPLLLEEDDEAAALAGGPAFGANLAVATGAGIRGRSPWLGWRCRLAPVAGSSGGAAFCAGAEGFGGGAIGALLLQREW